MSVNESKAKMNLDIMGTPVDTGKSSEESPASQILLDNLRKRVLDLLKASDPVCGIYAMYGAHERHPLCIPEK